jgi:hypothetical protein
VANAGLLDVAVEGGSEWVHDLLLQNSDGSFRLIIWGERTSGEEVVTVRFRANQSALKVFDVRSGTEAIRSLVNTRAMTVTVSDHPIIIAIASADSQP